MTTLQDRDESAAAPAGGSPSHGIGHRLGIFALILFLVGGISLGLLLTSTAGDTDRPDATVLTQQEVTDRLVRDVATSEVEIEVLYTPGWYFEWSARSEPEVDVPSVGFFVFETVHQGVLPSALPSFVVTSDGNLLTPTYAASIDNSEHHRVTQLLFAAETEDGFRLVRDGDELVADVDGMISGTVSWNLDDSFGADLIGGGGSLGIVSGKLTIPALFAIFGGMLTALSPCLLLLATYYTAVLSGTTVGTAAADKASKRLVTTSLAFVLGFTVIYTAGGVFAGWVGDSVRRLDSVGDWSKPISMIAGAIVILLGIRMAAQTRVPLVCKMPGFNRPSKSGFGGSVAMGGTFAVGCLSCFSVTVLSALLLYAGATGSAITGGLIMLTFSAGTGLIFILAAYLVARVVPVMGILDRARPYIGGISAAIMIALGLLMLTYNFHKFTGWIFTLWSWEMTITTRERLVDAAAELLREYPYHSVGVQALCDRAEVRKGSFYHFFESKEELTIAAIDRAWDSYKLGLAQLPLDRADLDERLRLIMANCLSSPLVHSLSGERLVGCPFGRLAASITEHEPLLRKRLAEIFDEWITLITELADGDTAMAWSTLAEIQGLLLLRATMDPQTVAVP